MGTLQLQHEILVNAVALEHPMAAVAVEPGSVARAFSIWGASGFLKHQGFPREGGSVLIEFPLTQTMREIHLKVESNWGGLFTCLYSIRVFGRRHVNSANDISERWRTYLELHHAF